MNSELQQQLSAFDTMFAPLRVKAVLDPSGVERWKDADIAKWLGCARGLGDIREVILRNVLELLRHGPVVVDQSAPHDDLFAGDVLLNFKQVGTICMLAETPRAHDIHTTVVRTACAHPVGRQVIARKLAEIGFAFPLSDEGASA